MNILDLINELEQIMDRNDWINGDIGREEIAHAKKYWPNHFSTSGISFSPCILLYLGGSGKLDIMTLYEFDDCNQYQDEGYYTKLLEKLNGFSDGAVSVSDVKEEWNHITNDVVVKYCIGGKEYSLEFNCAEISDRVPLVFFEEFDKLVNSIPDSGGKKVFRVQSEGCVHFFYLDKKEIAKIESIEKEFHRVYFEKRKNL